MPLPVKDSELAPPWRDKLQWQEANHVLSIILNKDKKKFAPCRRVAKEIHDLLLPCHELMRSLANKTCSICPNPCCLVADPWFDFRDLLFFNLLQIGTPLMQIQKKSGLGCSYLGTSGCLLPRMLRPWICTWYICPRQKEYLEKHFIKYISLNTRLSQAKGLRKKMENEFIDQTSCLH